MAQSRTATQETLEVYIQRLASSGKKESQDRSSLERDEFYRMNVQLLVCLDDAKGVYVLNATVAEGVKACMGVKL